MNKGRYLLWVYQNLKFVQATLIDLPNLYKLLLCLKLQSYGLIIQKMNHAFSFVNSTSWSRLVVVISMQTDNRNSTMLLYGSEEVQGERYQPVSGGDI